MPLDDLNQHPFELIRMPSEPTLEGLRTWILGVSEYLGVTPTEIARTAEVAPSTINKFLADTTQTKGLTAKTLQKLVRAASDIHNRKFGEAYAHRPRDSHADPAGYSVVNVRVASSLRADSFKASHLWPLQQQFFTSVLIPNVLRTGAGPEESLKPGGFQGFVVADTHADRSFPRSTVVIGAPFSLETDNPEPGQHFVVSRSDSDGKTELTIRLFMVSPSGDMWLLSRASAGQLPDVHLGRVDFEVKYRETEKFTPAKKSDYTIEYKVICVLLPQSDAYEALEFPT
jgi:hypothetical protein